MPIDKEQAAGAYRLLQKPTASRALKDVSDEVQNFDEARELGAQALADIASGILVYAGPANIQAD